MDEANRKLYNASAYGAVESVKSILTEVPNIDVNWRNENGNGNTALYIACARGSTGTKNSDLFSYLEIVKLLLEKGADPEITNYTGKSPLYIAASWGYWDIVRTLIGKGAKATATNGGVGARTPMDIASHPKPRLYANIDHDTYHSNYGLSRKHYAYKLAKVYMEELMESKKYLEFLPSIEEDYKTLIRDSAQAEFQDYPDDVMDIAVFYNHFSTIVELALAADLSLLPNYAEKLQKQRNLFALDPKNQTEDEQGERLYNAASWGNIKEVEKLLNSLPSIEKIINWKNKKGNTPLYIACAWGAQEEESGNEVSYFEIAKLLIKSGGDINAVNNFNKSPLFISASWGLWNIVELLIVSGANVDKANYSELNIAAYIEPRTRQWASKKYYNNHEIASKHHLCDMAKKYMEKVKKSEEYLELLPSLMEDYEILTDYSAGDMDADIPDYIMAIVLFYNHFATIVELVRAIDEGKPLKQSDIFTTYKEKLSRCDKRGTFKTEMKPEEVSDMDHE